MSIAPKVPMYYNAIKDVVKSLDIDVWILLIFIIFLIIGYIAICCLIQR